MLLEWLLYDTQGLWCLREAILILNMNTIKNKIFWGEREISFKYILYVQQSQEIAPVEELNTMRVGGAGGGELSFFYWSPVLHQQARWGTSGHVRYEILAFSWILMSEKQKGVSWGEKSQTE